jgi:nucleoside-diphosphate-sugar epimerase
MDATVLLTGATGSLGREVLRQLLGRDASVVLLLRPGNDGAERRFSSLVRGLAGDVSGAAVDRFSFVSGDLSLAGAGLAREDGDRLGREVTHVLHLAADTRFSLPLAEARAGNLDTTLELVRLAEGFADLRAFGFASTLYVAGTRTGQIREDDLADTTFVNTYERAKFETERALRARMDHLPVAVYRVATLLGSARTGEVSSPTAIHRALRLYHRGLVPMIPGDPAQPVELLDVEHAAEAVSRLLLHSFAPGKTHHVMGGPERSFRLGDLIDETHRGFAALDPDWARRGIEPPAVVSARTYALFERTVHEAADPAMAAVVRAMATFVPQLLYPKTFDRANSTHALPGWDPPHVGDYYRKVLSRLLTSRWGRRAEEAGAVASS